MADLLTDGSQPTYVRPEAKAIRPDLNLLADLLGGTRRMWDMSQERRYIRKWTDEKVSVYHLRRQCETLFEGFARVLSAAVGMLWAKPPALEWNASQAAMEEHWDNLDGAGTKGEVLAKRFSDQALRDGVGLILVDHPGPPEGVEVVTEAITEQYNLRPMWALYQRAQLLSWRVGKVQNRAEPVQVVLEECEYAPLGTYGVLERKRYRVLKLTQVAATADDTGGLRASWELYEEVKDGSVLGTVKKVGEGTFRNRDGEYCDRLPIAVAYTGRTDAPFCASIPLLGVAYANLSHWQLATELRFGRMVAAIEQPVVIGTLSPEPNAQGAMVPGTLKLGWLTGVKIEAGGDFKWAGPSGKGLEQLAAGVEEKREQIGQMGMSFLVSDTRAAETAQAKVLDATAENATLATAAQGIEDALNTALELHAWYLGIPADGAPVLTINRDFTNTVLDPATMLAYVTACREVGFPVSLLLAEWQRGGRIPQDADLDELELEMIANAEAEAERKRQEAEQRAKGFGQPAGAPE